MDHKDQEIHQLRQALQHSQSELAEKELRLSQAKDTIKHQSDAIQNPRGTSRFTTPHHSDENKPLLTGHSSSRAPPPRFDLSGTISQPRHPQVNQHGYNQVLPQTLPKHCQQSLRPLSSNSTIHPPSSPLPSQPNLNFYEPGLFQPQSVYQNTNFTHPAQSQRAKKPTHQPYTTGGSTTTEPYPSNSSLYRDRSKPSHIPHMNSQSSTNSSTPNPIQRRANPQGNYSGPRSYQTSRVSSQPEQPVASPNPQISMALVRVAEPSYDPGFAAKFQTLFTMADRYAFAHVNFPSSTKDSWLNSSIKDRLTKASLPVSPYSFMSNAQTRYLMVAKILNGWICKHILKATSFKGFDKEADARIDHNRNQIYASKSSSFLQSLKITYNADFRYPCGC